MISLFCFQKGLIQVLPMKKVNNLTIHGDLVLKEYPQQNDDDMKIHGIIPYEPTAINSNKKKKLIDREYIRGFKHGLDYILVVKCGVKIL